MGGPRWGREWGRLGIGGREWEGWWCEGAEPVECRWARCDGGWEKALGWGLNTGVLLDGRPRAVAFSSPSLSESVSIAEPLGGSCWRRWFAAGCIASVELVMTRSSSLSVSSYSSWLLVAPLWLAGWPTINEAGMGRCCCCDRLRLGGYELLPTLRPVVTMSSPMDDRDDDDGCEATSTQDSEFAGISLRPRLDAAASE